MSFFDHLCGQRVRMVDFPPWFPCVADRAFAAIVLHEGQSERTAAIAAKIPWKSFEL